MPESLVNERDALRKEVAELRDRLESKEEELRLLERLVEIRVGQVPAQNGALPSHRQQNGRRSLTQAIYRHLEVDGRKFRTVGDLLDYYGEPHYFSRVRPRQKDSAERQVLAWARRNPHLAGGVSVLLKDGTLVSLSQLVASL
jgi:hypothetical protein